MSFERWLTPWCDDFVLDWFHTVKLVTKTRDAFQTTFSETFLFVFLCKWTAKRLLLNIVKAVLGFHFCLYETPENHNFSALIPTVSSNFSGLLPNTHKFSNFTGLLPSWSIAQHPQVLQLYWSVAQLVYCPTPTSPQTLLVYCPKPTSLQTLSISHQLSLGYYDKRKS